MSFYSNDVFQIDDFHNANEIRTQIKRARELRHKRRQEIEQFTTWRKEHESEHDRR